MLAGTILSFLLSVLATAHPSSTAILPGIRLPFKLIYNICITTLTKAHYLLPAHVNIPPEFHLKTCIYYLPIVKAGPMAHNTHIKFYSFSKYPFDPQMILF
uniref:Secreted protein n=1 Tax=Anguilla anguilla TaxID=7936 RepID=A0A0E9R3I0_ANGAN